MKTNLKISWETIAGSATTCIIILVIAIGKCKNCLLLQYIALIFSTSTIFYLNSFKFLSRYLKLPRAKKYKSYKYYLLYIAANSYLFPIGTIYAILVTTPLFENIQQGKDAPDNFNLRRFILIICFTVIAHKLYDIVSFMKKVSIAYTTESKLLYILFSYFIIGFNFAFIYALDGGLVNNSSYSSDNPQIIDFIYFSFITLSTIGFGDYVPVSSFIKWIVIMESFISLVFTSYVLVLLFSRNTKEEIY